MKTLQWKNAAWKSSKLTGTLCNRFIQGDLCPDPDAPYEFEGWDIFVGHLLRLCGSRIREWVIIGDMMMIWYDTDSFIRYYLVDDSMP